MNTDRFIVEPRKYFADAYEQFSAFGGPCVYFHRQCLRAEQEDFLSERHIEMLYATLTSWGMHRLGTDTLLTGWDRFHASILSQKAVFQQFRTLTLLDTPEAACSGAIRKLQPCYREMDLSENAATIVVNSKAFHHFFQDSFRPSTVNIRFGSLRNFQKTG